MAKQKDAPAADVATAPDTTHHFEDPEAVMMAGGGFGSQSESKIIDHTDLDHVAEVQAAAKAETKAGDTGGSTNP